MKGSRVALTMERIARASCPPDKRQALLWDSEQRGFGVRVYPNGRKVFVLFYRADGGGRSAAQRWLTLGDVGKLSLKAAREAAKARFGDIAKGDDPAEKREEERRRERAKLDKALDAYEASLEGRKIVRCKVIMALLRGTLLRRFGSIELAKLDRAKLVGLIQSYADAGQRGKAQDLRVKAAVFFNWCANSGLITASPLAGWRQQRQSRAERLARAGRALGDREIPILWRAFDACDDRAFAAYCKTLLLTGQRRTETALMRDAQLDDGPTAWTIPAEITKSGREHRVPIPPELARVLAGSPRLSRCDLVFPGRRGRPISGFSKRLAPIRKATDAAGLAAWTLHDLRRTVRTGLGRLGVEPLISELLLNHAIGDELSATYDRGEYWAKREEAAARWAAHVLELVAADPGRGAAESRTENVIPLRIAS